MIESLFPGLQGQDWEITSLSTPVYNCIAWAAGDEECWWQPDSGLGGYYWPTNLPPGQSISNYVRAFRQLGYRECGDGALEQGFEKIALYVNDSGDAQHAARQLPDGTWTSKLGKGHDIQHGTAESLCGDQYGQIAVFMRRPHHPGRPHPRMVKTI
jgi:hypothetical protein